MSGFSADWLALREPLDRAARAQTLSAAFAAAVRATGAQALDIVDLGAGTGANLRYLAPLLGGAQCWRLIDADTRLLAALERRTADWAAARVARVAREPGGALAVEDASFRATLETVAADLADAAAALALPAGAIVTASALLDLVSAEWLAKLAAACRDAAASALFALTYDGRSECEPADPDDALVLQLFNAHQRGDKGFGPALGPDAAAAAADAFAALGYRVETAASDWRIGAEHRALQAELVDGWCRAAAEAAPEHSAALAAWRDQRLAQAAAGELALIVGHVDLAAYPQ